MSELRKEFESLCERNRLDIYGEFANGAWWAYQEQHKKIVAYQKMIEMQKAFDKANDVFRSTERIAKGMCFGGYIEPRTRSDPILISRGEYHADISTMDNPHQTIVFNIDENGNIDVINDNGEQE